MISKKVILTGSFGVGKTSLFNRFVYNRFDEKYLTTIGVKVDKKVISIDNQELSMLIWDIAGEVSQNKVPRSYFLGTSGIIYVFDLSRPLTANNLVSDLQYLREMLPNIAIKVVGNKQDLVSEEIIASFREQFPIDITTSAKTGDSVEDMFYLLGKDLLNDVKSQTI